MHARALIRAEDVISAVNNGQIVDSPCRRVIVIRTIAVSSSRHGDLPHRSYRVTPRDFISREADTLGYFRIGQGRRTRKRTGE
jgi:hypothetical protein